MLLYLRGVIMLHARCGQIEVLVPGIPPGDMVVQYGCYQPQGQGNQERRDYDGVAAFFKHPNVLMLRGELERSQRATSHYGRAGPAPVCHEPPRRREEHRGNEKSRGDHNYGWPRGEVQVK